MIHIDTTYNFSYLKDEMYPPLRLKENIIFFNFYYAGFFLLLFMCV